MTDGDAPKDADEQQEKVGYGNPPKKHQYKPGVSGNPSGRPGRSRNLKTVLEDELLKPVVVNENGRRRTRPRIDVMVSQAVAKAMQGDPRAFSNLMGFVERTGALGAEKEAAGQLSADDQALLDDLMNRRMLDASTIETGTQANQEDGDADS